MTQLLTLRVRGSLFLLVNTHSFWPCVRIGTNVLLQQNQNPKPRPLLWPVVEDTDTKGPLLCIFMTVQILKIRCFYYHRSDNKSVAFIITVVRKLSAKGLGIWNNDPQKKNIKHKIYNENHCYTHAHIKKTQQSIFTASCYGLKFATLWFRIVFLLFALAS